MFDQLLKDWEKAAEASRQMQQEIFTHWTQPWMSAMSNAGIGTESRASQKQWMEFAIDMLNRQRESMDATYQSGVQFLQHAMRSTEVTSPEDYRRTVEELWRQMMESFKKQSETQMRDFQNWAEKSFEMAKKTAA